MNRVFREEKKYLISLPEALQACHRLAQVMHEDPHNGISGYPVRSLYFDTLDDRDFHEKAAGVELRRKLRLRCYDPAADFAMLEMKQKQGASQLKRSLRVTREDAQALTRGDYAPRLRYPESFAAECYALMHSRCYRPKTIVEYDRKAFIAKENKIRITFDSRIVSVESCFDLFSPRLNMNPVLDPYCVVLEVKYNGFLLDYLRELINSVDRSELFCQQICACPPKRMSDEAIGGKHHETTDPEPFYHTPRYVVGGYSAQYRPCRRAGLFYLPVLRHLPPRDDLQPQVPRLILAGLTGTVMTVIGNNIALSLGMVGALSIVRFRTAIKDSRDTVYIFWSIIVGICCGVGDYAVACIGSAVTFAVILLLGCIKSDNRMLLIIRAHRSNQEPIKAQVYKLFRAKATLRVENTTEDTVELIYEITQKLLRRAEQTTPDIPGSIYSLGSIDYVNLVMQNDEVSN